MEDEWWPEDEEDGAPLPPPGAVRPAPLPPQAPDYRPHPNHQAAPPGQPLFDPLNAYNETTVQPDYGGTGPDPRIGITASGQETGRVDNTATQPARRIPGEPRRPEDYPDGQAPGRPSIAQSGQSPDTAGLDPRTPSRIAADGREELARETTRREDGRWEEPARQQIYAPTPVEGRTAVAGVPVALPPRTPVVPAQRTPPPEEQRPPDQIQPGQQVSAEWRHERQTPLDLPQAPESAWAQPPTAPLPIVTPRSAPPTAPAPPRPRAPRESGQGVPHQVPPAPMPRIHPPSTERPAEPPAEMGVQAALRRTTFGLISPAPGRREQELIADIEEIRRNFGGLRQVTVVNPREGSGKTVAVLMLSMTFGRRRGGHVLAWDTDEAQPMLGSRAQADSPATVRDLLRDLHSFQADRRGGDLSQYVRAQGDAMFEVLASAGDTALAEDAFGDVRDVLGRFYKIVVVDTGEDVHAPVWPAAVDATDQLVVTLTARDGSAETAARLLDHMEQAGRVRAVRQAVTVLSLPQNQREFDVPGIERHFSARTRAVIRVPYDRVIDTGEPIDYRQLSEATRAAWIKVAAAVAEGL